MPITYDLISLQPSVSLFSHKFFLSDTTNIYPVMPQGCSDKFAFPNSNFTRTILVKYVTTRYSILRHSNFTTTILVKYVNMVFHPGTQKFHQNNTGEVRDNTVFYPET
jgi:hypothetical protein